MKYEENKIHFDTNTLLISIINKQKCDIPKWLLVLILHAKNQEYVITIMLRITHDTNY